MWKGKIVIDFLKRKESNEQLQINSLSVINDDKQYQNVINIYKLALEEVVDNLTEVKQKYYDIFKDNLINNIVYRIKTPESIINKMKKKGYDLNYENLFTKINDIAGVRVVCLLKDNIYTLIRIIEKLPGIKVIKRKDYITKPKKSGYSGYHLIIEKVVVVNNRELAIKIEIQLRTMAMDFWSTNEHSLKYKTKKKLSKSDSRRLTLYAKVLNYIDNKIAKIYSKQLPHNQLC